MDHLKNLKNYLLKEINKTNKILSATRISRNNAPTAMESKSDTSRSRYESEIEMHELKLKELQTIIKQIPNHKKDKGIIELWSMAEVELSSNKLSLIIVTPGLGGTKIGKIQCVSSNTPAGKALLGKKTGDTFSFNDNSGQVLLIK